MLLNFQIQFSVLTFFSDFLFQKMLAMQFIQTKEKVLFSFNLLQNLFVNFLAVFLVEGTVMFPCTGKTVVSG